MSVYTRYIDRELCANNNNNNNNNSVLWPFDQDYPSEPVPSTMQYQLPPSTMIDSILPFNL